MKLVKRINQRSTYFMRDIVDPDTDIMLANPARPLPMVAHTQLGLPLSVDAFGKVKGEGATLVIHKAYSRDRRAAALYAAKKAIESMRFDWECAQIHMELTNGGTFITWLDPIEVK